MCMSECLYQCICIFMQVCLYALTSFAEFVSWISIYFNVNLFVLVFITKSNTFLSVYDIVNPSLSILRV